MALWNRLIWLTGESLSMSGGSVRDTNKGVLVRVRVRPRSKKSGLFFDFDENELTVNLRSPAREGKANSELLKLLARRLKVSTGSLRLVGGQRSKEKTILIEGVTGETVVRMLREVTNDK